MMASTALMAACMSLLELCQGSNPHAHLHPARHPYPPAQPPMPCAGPLALAAPTKQQSCHCNWSDGIRENLNKDVHKKCKRGTLSDRRLYTTKKGIRLPSSFGTVYSNPAYLISINL